MKMEIEGTRQRGCLRKTCGIVSKGIREVLACPKRMFRIENFRDHCRLKIKGELANPGLPGKWPLQCAGVF